MLGRQWSHSKFLLLLSSFLFFHFAMFFRFFIAKMTSNDDSGAGLAGRHSDHRAKQVYCDKVGFLKNFPRVSADF